jgi:hypothetical protein
VASASVKLATSVENQGLEPSLDVIRSLCSAAREKQLWDKRIRLFLVSRCSVDIRPNRSGISTLATALAKDNGLAAKWLLTRSQLATTERNYIHTIPSQTLAAMAALEREFPKYGAKMEQSDWFDGRSQLI